MFCISPLAVRILEMALRIDPVGDFQTSIKQMSLENQLPCTRTGSESEYEDLSLADTTQPVHDALQLLGQKLLHDR